MTGDRESTKDPHREDGQPDTLPVPEPPLRGGPWLLEHKVELPALSRATSNVGTWRHGAC